jgi:hypothetical protein
VDDPVGDRRLPVVSRSVLQPVAAILAIALLGSGCLAPGPGPSRSGSTPPRATVAPSLAGSSAARTPSSETPSDAASATPLPDPPELTRPLATLTIVCASWPGEPPDDAVECDDAARLALAAIGGDAAASVRRLDVGFAGPCRDDATCPPSITVRWVEARSAAFETLLVRVERTADGTLLVWPPVEGRVDPPPQFDPPPPARPKLPDDAPVELREREPLAMCGVETVDTPDDFDTPARRCFLDGVLAWTGVELVSHATGAGDGDGVVTTVDRFTGSGPIRRFVRADGRWSAADCAINPIDTIGVYVLAPPCRPVELHG